MYCCYIVTFRSSQKRTTWTWKAVSRTKAKETEAGTRRTPTRTGTSPVKSSTSWERDAARMVCTHNHIHTHTQTFHRPKYTLYVHTYTYTVCTALVWLGSFISSPHVLLLLSFRSSPPAREEEDTDGVRDGCRAVSLMDAIVLVYYVPECRYRVDARRLQLTTVVFNTLNAEVFNA